MKSNSKISKLLLIVLIFAQFTILSASCSECNDEKYIKLSNMQINDISEEDFVYYLDMHDDCYDCRDNVGIFVNQLNNPDYIALMQNDISSLTKNEFALLLYLQKRGFEFQEKFDYFVNICENPIFKNLNTKPRDLLSNNETTIFNLLHDNCEEQKSDIEDGKKIIWFDSTGLNPDRDVDFKSIGKYFLGGGALFAGGGVILSYISVAGMRDEQTDFAEAVFLLIPYVFGIVATAVGTGLLTTGLIKISVDYSEYAKGVEELKANPYGTNFKLGINIPVKRSIHN